VLKCRQRTKCIIGAHDRPHYYTRGITTSKTNGNNGGGGGGSNARVGLTTCFVHFLQPMMRPWISFQNRVPLFLLCSGAKCNILVRCT